VTQTFVRYFNDEDLALIKQGYQQLAADLESRRPYISKRTAAAMERRLEVLRHAWALLLEPVAESLLS